MSEAVKLAEHYVALSNAEKLDEIKSAVEQLKKKGE